MVRPVVPGEPRPGFGGGVPNARNLTIFGAYQLVGRLNDIPVGLSQPKHELVRDPSNLSRWVPPYNGSRQEVSMPTLQSMADLLSLSQKNSVQNGAATAPP